MASGIRIPLISDWDPSGINKAKRDFAKLETTGQKASFALKKAFLPATAALAGLGAASVAFINAGERAATSNARIEQIATSMQLFGNETQTVTKRLTHLAEAQARATGVDQNAIKEAQAKLLTFKELAVSADEMGGSFDRATQLTLDLAAAGFGSATENATQLGKALNDPVKGITALTRSGITFTEAEKEQIAALVEAGKTFEAQDMILKAIETQVGGTAEATANATDKLKVGFSQMSEQLGLALLPVLESLMPLLMGIVDFIGNNTDVVIGIGTAIGGFAAAIVAANIALRTWQTMTAVTTALNTALGTSFTALQVASGAIIFAALIGVIVVLQKKFNIFGKAVDAVTWYFRTWWTVVKWVIAKIIDAINWLIRAWNKIPFIDDIAEIDTAFLDLDKTVSDASEGMIRSMEDVETVVGSATGEAERFANQLQDTGREMSGFARIDAPKLTQAVDGARGAVDLLDLELRYLYDTLKREDAVDAFQTSIDQMIEAVGTDGFEKELRNAKEAAFQLQEQVGGFSSLLQQEFQLAIDTQDVERLNTLILSIRENWSGFTSSDIPTFEDLNYGGSLLARAERTAREQGVYNIPGGFGGVVGSTNITVNLPAGTNGDDVANALSVRARRRGVAAIPINAGTRR